MKVEDYIYKVAALKRDLGINIPITPEAAVDIYQLEGIIPDCADWRYDELNACIWLDGIPAIFNVPNDWTLGELYHNISVMLRFHKGFMKWE